MTLTTYEGKLGVTYGFRFVYRGQLYKAKGFPNKGLAKDAEKAERRRVEELAFEARWGPRTPRLTKWDEVARRYAEAKADKLDLLQHDLPRLAWWRAFFEGQGIPYLQAVTPDAIDRAKTQLRKAGRRPATIQRYLAVLRHLFQLAIRRWRLVAYNPVLAVDWPKATPYHARIPTRAERQKLLAAAQPFLQVIILVGLHTGLRKGSLLRLEADDYRREPEVLRVVQKGGRELRLPMTPPLRKLLDGLGIAKGRLFRWPDGRAMHHFPRKAWERALAKAGLSERLELPYTDKRGKPRVRIRWRPLLRFHDLRHCMGTVLAEAGVEARLIQELLGHAGIRTSERYTRPHRPALRRAAMKATRLMGLELPQLP